MDPLSATIAMMAIALPLMFFVIALFVVGTILLNKMLPGKE